MPDARLGCSGATFVNDELFVVGGWNPQSPLPYEDLFAFNPARNSWRR
jgi:N-acetylneuraminic acid mutarotase